jgi:uncharacterized protein (DUF302 family)
MSYYFSKALNIPLDEAVEKVSAALEGEGFSVLTDIDMKATMKRKLGVEFRDYRILGACNPRFAHLALTVEDWIGTMLPCNVVVQKRDGGTVEVAAVDPVASMKAVENPQLLKVAAELRKKLQSVIESL